MISKQLGAALVLAVASTSFSGTAFAVEATQIDYASIMKMPMMDKNKDGMVSKKEFMAMMEKAYDMKAKEMGAKKGMMTEAQIGQFLKSLYTGG